LNTYREWNSKTRSFIKTMREKRCWATKDTMEIPKPEQACGPIRKAKKENASLKYVYSKLE